MPLTGASTFSTFRENKVFGTSVFFQTLLDAAWLFPFWNQVFFLSFFSFLKKSGCFVKIRDCCVKIADWELPLKAPSLPDPCTVHSPLAQVVIGERVWARLLELPFPQSFLVLDCGVSRRWRELVGPGSGLAEPCSPGGSSAAGRDVTAAWICCPFAFPYVTFSPLYTILTWGFVYVFRF